MPPVIALPNLEIVLDRPSLKDVGLKADSPVTCQLSGVSLRSLLHLMLGELDLKFHVRDDAIYVTTLSALEGGQSNYVGKVYPVLPLVTGADGNDEQSLAEVITRSFELTDWADVGGNGDIEIAPGALLVIQLSHVHRQVEDLLAVLEQLQSNPDRIAPITLGAAGHGESRAISKALEANTNIDFIDTPLEDVLDHLTAKHNIPIWINHQALEDLGVSSDTPISFTVADIPLRSALRWMLNSLQLTFDVRHEVLFVTTPEFVEQDLITRVYPIRDLLSDSNELDVDTLIELITTCIAPDMWEEVGGPGSMPAWDGCLIISQTLEVHQEIEKLLAGLRRVYDPFRLSTPDAHFSPSRRRIERALNQQVTLRYDNIRLYVIVDELASKHEINILFDTRALDDIGIHNIIPITCDIVDVPLGKALRRMLHPVETTITVIDDVILVGQRHLAIDFSFGVI